MQKKFEKEEYVSDFTIAEKPLLGNAEQIVLEKKGTRWLRVAQIVLLIKTFILLGIFLNQNLLNEFVQSNEDKVNATFLDKGDWIFIAYLISQPVLFITSFFLPRISVILAAATLYFYWAYDASLIMAIPVDSTFGRYSKILLLLLIFGFFATAYVMAFREKHFSKLEELPS